MGLNNKYQVQEILNAVFNRETASLNTGLTFSGDVEIGAVEIKNGTDDTRAAVNANNQLLTAPGAANFTADSQTSYGVYNIDQVANTTAYGNPNLVVRDDALSTLTPADGDWAPMRVDSQGALWVAVSSPVNATITTNQTTIGHGHKEVTTAGTDVVLAGSTTCKRVTIQAYLANTGKIAVGATGVDASATIGTGTGVILSAGDSISFDVTNLATVFIDSTVNGEGVRYIYHN